MLTVHFFHCSYKIGRLFEADETETFTFARSFVAYDFRFHKRWIFVECSRQHFVVHIVSQIAAEYTKIIILPIGKRMVLPHLTTGCAYCLRNKMNGCS